MIVVLLLDFKFCTYYLFSKETGIVNPVYIDRCPIPIGITILLPVISCCFVNSELSFY